METGEDNIGKLSAAQLKEWTAQANEMEVQAGPAKAEAEDEFRREETERKLTEPRSAAELAWQNLKARIRQSAR